MSEQLSKSSLCGATRRNHTDGTVYRVRKEWRGLADLLDKLVDDGEGTDD